MADTARTIAALKALWADNLTGDISPQDGRDLIDTLRVKYGELYIADGDEAATTISNTTSYFDLAGAFTLGQAFEFDESAGNGQLTYTGGPTIIVAIIVTASLVAASGTNVCHLRIEKDGVDIGGGDSESIVITTAIHSSLIGITPMATGESLTVAIRNETGAVNVTANECHIICLGIAI